MYVGPDGVPVDRDGNVIVEGGTLDDEGFIVGPNGQRYTPQGQVLNVDQLPDGVTVGADGVPRSTTDGEPTGPRGTSVSSNGTIAGPDGMTPFLPCFPCCVFAVGWLMFVW